MLRSTWFIFNCLTVICFLSVVDVSSFIKIFCLVYYTLNTFICLLSLDNLYSLVSVFLLRFT